MSTAATLALALLAGAPAESKTVTFLGFSASEEAAAWRVETSRPQPDGSVARLAMVQVVRTADNRLVATFRDGAPRRTSAGGARLPLDAPALDAANADWAAARPGSEWRKLKSKGRFRAKPLRMSDSTVRLSRDGDCDVDMTAAESFITVGGRSGGAVGFEPVGRLMDGRLVSLGHFRQEGEPGATWEARVEVFHSVTGMHVAVLSRFTREGAPPAWLGRVTRLPDALGTTGIGTMRLIFSNMRQAEQTFDELHPGMEEAYDEYGKW